MKHFMDYKPTRKEIEESFGDLDGPKTMERIKLIEGTDTEKFEIAALLVDRGKNRAALKMIESIENAEYREDMRRIVQSWIYLPPGALW